ncbi:MAG: erythromycin esterase family protein [Armatimonadota bacterium]
MLAALSLATVLSLQGNWLGQNAIPLSPSGKFSQYDDLKKLRSMLDGVRIVGMGEATHGTREFFETKHRMFRFLVEEMGFRVFILEASMAGCLMMDDYVLGKKVDVKEAIYRQQFWTWSVVELRELLEWMREYNRTHAEKLRVFGNDMQNSEDPMVYFLSIKGRLKNFPNDTKFPTQDAEWESWLPLIKAQLGEEEFRISELVLATYRQAKGNDWISELRLLQQRVIPKMQETFSDAEKLLKELPNLDPAARSGLEFVDQHKTKLVQEAENTREGAQKMKEWKVALIAAQSKATSDKKLSERIRLQVDLLDFLLFIGTMPKGLNPGNYRDQCMATNSTTIIETVLPSSKAMIWAHNGHIGRAKFAQGFEAMGWHLDNLWKEKYVPLAFAFSEGSFRASDGNQVKTHKVGASKGGLETLLRKEGPKEDFFLPVRGPSGLPDFLRPDLTSRQIGAIWNAQVEKVSTQPFNLPLWYDGLFFFHKTTSARALN